jgi:hypothetical protein
MAISSTGNRTSVDIDAQATVLEHRRVREFMGGANRLLALPPQADHVDELGVGREQLGEGGHVMSIPRLGEC